MSKGNFFVPDPVNEPILSYAPCTPEREELLAKYKEMYSQEIDAPMYIGSEEVYTDNKIKMTCPMPINIYWATFQRAVPPM